MAFNNLPADGITAPLLALVPELESTFVWNNRKCKGNNLHVAALEGKLEYAKEFLEKHTLPEVAFKERFSYETVFKGSVQEGSGEAIHLAASRGHVEVVQYLMEKRAEISALVTRDHKPHYDVLHAAMFAEGRGGSLAMIQYLFEANAEMSRNLDGKYPLHIAFQTGNVDVIALLRQHMESQGASDNDYLNPEVPLPLELGISQGKMSEEQLAEAAELTTKSLEIFIHNCPQCIPPFFATFAAGKGCNSHAACQKSHKI